MNKNTLNESHNLFGNTIHLINREIEIKISNQESIDIKSMILGKECVMLSGDIAKYEINPISNTFRFAPSDYSECEWFNAEYLFEYFNDSEFNFNALAKFYDFDEQDNVTGIADVILSILLNESMIVVLDESGMRYKISDRYIVYNNEYVEGSTKYKY